MEPSFTVDPVARLSDEMTHSQRAVDEDLFFAALASAEGADDEIEDADCAGAVAAIDAAAVELGRALSARVLAAKSAVAQKAQHRQAQVQAEAAADVARLEHLLDDERQVRQQLEQKLARSFVIQTRLADSLAATRESGAARLQQTAVLAAWNASMLALKREAYTERIALKHAASTLLRMCVGRWRTKSRASRHKRIDAFWEQAVTELREALQGHYEPRLAGLNGELEAARADAASAWRAKEELGMELKQAFMKQVSQVRTRTRARYAYPAPCTGGARGRGLTGRVRACRVCRAFRSSTSRPPRSQARSSASRRRRRPRRPRRRRGAPRATRLRSGCRRAPFVQRSFSSARVADCRRRRRDELSRVSLSG